MIVDKGALENVKYLFEQVYHKPVSEVNLKQAEVPDVCEVIQNKRGSAPGMVFQKDEAIFISMPGVPYEMMGIMEEVIPYLQNHLSFLLFFIRLFLLQVSGNLRLRKLSKILKTICRMKLDLPICRIMEW